MKQGEIRLALADGAGAVVSSLITDGAYSISAMPGANRVEIQAFEQTGVEPMDASMPGSATVPVMKPLLPAKYNIASELTLEVTGDVEKNFDLTTP